jgi:hypothetical protein
MDGWMDGWMGKRKIEEIRRSLGYFVHTVVFTHLHMQAAGGV